MREYMDGISGYRTLIELLCALLLVEVMNGHARSSGLT